MSYNKIYDYNTKKYISIFSENGKQIIESYKNLIGGEKDNFKKDLKNNEFILTFKLNNDNKYNVNTNIRNEMKKIMKIEDKPNPQYTDLSFSLKQLKEKFKLISDYIETNKI